MNAAVVYESSFGNTRAVAEAIAEALGARVFSVDEAPPDLAALDVLVVGGPTHVHGMSGERSRRAAADEYGAPEPGIGVREWIEAMPEARQLRVAAFDTRVAKPVAFTGSAARGIAKRLRRRGLHLAVPPESFFVEGTTGPPAPHELDRAADWGARLRADR